MAESSDKLSAPLCQPQHVSLLGINPAFPVIALRGSLLSVHRQVLRFLSAGGCSPAPWYGQISSQSTTWSSFPANFSKPVPLAVVSLDSNEDQSFATPHYTATTIPTTLYAYTQ